MNDTLAYTIFGIVIAGLFAYILYREKNRAGQSDVSQNVLDELLRMKQELHQKSTEQKAEVQNRLDRVHDQLSRGMEHSQNSMQKQHTESQRTIQNISERLVELTKTNEKVSGFAEQLQELQHILKNPKQRGVLGEYWLETLLSNVLPNHKEMYKLQYLVGEDEKTGQKLIVDAAIFINEEVIPIDAKFTLENYNRMMKENDPVLREKLEKAFKSDVKKRIDETSKYIRPDLGTMNFAFMFIPAEGVYYNLLNAEIGSGINSNNLVEYAFSKSVMLVSPTSFYAYLQTVLLGLEKLQIEQKTQEIIKWVGELKRHMRSYEEYHRKLGNNLRTVVGQYDQTSSELRKVSKDVIKITNGSKEEIIDVESLDKPKIQ
jgi:DNA recombination protein RmuC